MLSRPALFDRRPLPISLKAALSRQAGTA